MSGMKFLTDRTAPGFFFGKHLNQQIRVADRDSKNAVALAEANQLEVKKKKSRNFWRDETAALLFRTASS